MVRDCGFIAEINIKLAPYYNVDDQHFGYYGNCNNLLVI